MLRRNTFFSPGIATPNAPNTSGYVFGVMAEIATSFANFTNKAKAVIAARKKSPDSFACIDLETTGGNPSNGVGVKEASLVLVRKRKVVRKFHWFINPHYQLGDELVPITARTGVKLFISSSFKNVFKHMVRVVGALPVLAHNAIFERQYLDYFSSVHKTPFAPFYIDSLSIARKVYPKMNSHELGRIVQRMGIKLGNQDQFHDASTDATVTAKVWLQMLRYLRAHKKDREKVDLLSIEHLQRGKHARNEGIILEDKEEKLLPLNFNPSQIRLLKPSNKSLPGNTIEEMHSLSVLRRDLRKGVRTLFVFGIDNVCIKPAQTLGSNSCFEHHRARFGIKQALRIFCAVQKTTEIVPVEPKLKDVISDLQDHPNSITVGFTSRSDELAEITHQQLQKVGVVMNTRKRLAHADIGGYGILNNGIFFTKGKCREISFHRFMGYLRRVGYTFDCVVFVGDELATVQAVSKVCKELKIDFKGYRYGRMDLANTIDTRVADLQLQLFRSPVLLKDHQAERLLEENVGAIEEANVGIEVKSIMKRKHR